MVGDRQSFHESRWFGRPSLLLNVRTWLLLVGVALVLLPLTKLAFPATSPASASDVIFVIGPPEGERLAFAASLMDQGLAHTLMVSENPGDNREAVEKLCDRPTPRTSDGGPDVNAPIITRQIQAGDLNGLTVPATVMCRVPNPYTTQGEARWLRDEMTANGWKTATVITVQTHATRAQLIMDRCTPTGVNVVGLRYGALNDTLARMVYEVGASFKALFITNTC